MPTQMSYHPRQSEHKPQTQDGRFSPQNYLKDASSLSRKVPPSGRFSKLRESSSKMVRRISYSLFPLISKFKALDALSLSIQASPLKPAPLHVSRRLTKRSVGSEESHEKRKWTIFKPKRSSQSEKENDPIDHRLVKAAGKNSWAATQKISSSINEPQSTRPSLQIPIYNGLCMKETHSVKLHISPFIDPKQDDWFVTDPRNRIWKDRGRSQVRDRVEYFDRWISPAANYPIPELTAISGTANLNARLSHGRPLPVAAISQELEEDMSRLDRDVLLGKSKARLPIIDPAIPNPFLAHNSTVRRGVPISISPKTLISNFDPKIVKDQQKVVEYLTSSDIISGMKVQGQISTKASPENRGPSLKVPGIKPISMSTERRKVSEKLKTIYRAESLERIDVPGQLHPVFPIISCTDPQVAKNIFEPSLIKRADDSRKPRKESKVREMKMLFDSKIVDQKGPANQLPLSKAFSMRFARSEKCEDTAKEKSPISSSSPPSSRPVSSQTKAPSIDKKVATNLAMPHQKSQLLKLKQTQIAPIVKEPTLSALQPLRPSHKDEIDKTVSGSIVDKMKIFEARVATEAMEGEVSTRSKLGPLTKTTNNHFRNAWSNWNEITTLDRGEIKNLVHDAQAVNMEGKSSGKSVSSRKRLNAIIVSRPVSTADHIAQGASENERNLEILPVIREVQCGLKEPKPLRLLELERMIMLCRGRNGDFYKERGGIGSNGNVFI